MVVFILLNGPERFSCLLKHSLRLMVFTFVWCSELLCFTFHVFFTSSFTFFFFFFFFFDSGFFFVGTGGPELHSSGFSLPFFVHRHLFSSSLAGVMLWYWDFRAR